MRRRTGAAAAGAAVLLALSAPQAYAAPRHGIQRVSTTVAGAQSATASDGGGISADGHYAVYGTGGPGDGCPADWSWCVFVKDLRTGKAVQVPGTGVETHTLMISGDGTEVGYTTGHYHYFRATVHDRRTGASWTLWPANPPKDGWYERSDLTGLSADGRYAAYTIGNRDGDGGALHLLVRDLTTGTDTLADPVGDPGDITGGRLSADGRYVASGTRKAEDTALYVTDRTTGRTRRLDTPAGGASSLVDISADGHHVLFNFRTSRPGSAARAYLADTRTGRAVPVGPAGSTALSADATDRYVLLADAGGALYLLDARTGHRHPVAGASAAATAVPGSVTRDGRSVVFTSAAALVPDDTNGVTDVFARRLG
ncbi:hypothetical protein A6P39_014355 [Streptomyces sp. FXJ1.172]|uniref:hypothetical protein n=1 Tax=Streptomyces sp. FXJ1.172 TaxID=710705 RepID=UPI00083671FC|nr:hypothetical protein [Streptomyces sp. FXJ1.172]WEO95101.1 hypothetical protein A6P39_014355 [Streptomyces sp. FXJ1.172]